jgi:hypothetical protein
MPLASLLAAGCKRVPWVSASSKGYEPVREKVMYLCTIFATKLNPKIGFLAKLLTLKFGYFDHCGSTLTLPTHWHHKNRESMSNVGARELFAIGCRDLG